MLGRFRELRRQVQEQVKKEETWPTIERARALLADGPEEEAAEFLATAVERFPASPELRLLNAFAIARFAPRDGAREATRAVELDPYEPWYLIPAACKIFEWTGAESARDYAARAREMGGEDTVWGPELIRLEAQFALEDGDEEAAEAGMRLAVEREPESEGFVAGLAEFLAGRGRDDEALEIVEAGLQSSKTTDRLARLKHELGGRRD